MSGMESLLLGGDSSSGESDDEVNVNASATAASAVAAPKPAPAPANPAPVASPSPAASAPAPAPAAGGKGGKAEAMKERLKNLYSASKSSAPGGGAAPPKPAQAPPQQQQPQMQQQPPPQQQQQMPQQPQQQQIHPSQRSYPSNQQKQQQQAPRQNYPPPQQNRQNSQSMLPPQRQAPSHPQQQQQQQQQHHMQRQQQQQAQQPPPQQQQQRQSSQHSSQGGGASRGADPFAPTPLAQITQRQQQQQQQHRMSQQQLQRQQQQPNAQQPPGLGTSVSRGSATGSLTSRSGRQHAESEGEVIHRRQKERFLMFTRVLIKYLEQKDKVLHAKAKQVIKDCAERNRRGDQGYESVTLAMQRRLKDLVGETYWKKAQEFLVLMHNKRKAQQQGQLPAGRMAPGQQLTDKQKRDMYNEQKRRQMAQAAAQKSTLAADKQGAPSLDKLRQDIHQQREQVALRSPTAQTGATPQVTAAAGKAPTAAAPAPVPAASKGKKAVRRKSGDASTKAASRKTSTTMKQSVAGGGAPMQIITAQQQPVVMQEPPREYEELMKLIDNAVDYDWPSIGQLLGDKDDLNISDEERQLLYGETSPMPANAMIAAKAAAPNDASAQPSGEKSDKTKPTTLPHPGWGRSNVLSVRSAWAKLRFKEQKRREMAASNPSPTVAGGLLSLPSPQNESGASASAAASSSKPTSVAEQPWVNEETAEQDLALALLSEGCEIYLKGVLQKAIHCARQRQNLDGIRLWHQQYAAIQEEPEPPKASGDAMEVEETPEEKAKKEEEKKKKMMKNKPPLSLRLGCDVSRQEAQAQGNAALTVKRMEEALERQSDVPSKSRDLGSVALSEATSMDDLAWRPLLKEGAKRADCDAKRSYEIYGGKESKDPPFGRVPKQAKLMVDDFIMGSKLSDDGRKNKAFTASAFISF